MLIRFLIASLVLLHGCSDFDCPDGQARVDGMCSPTDMGVVNPAPKAKRIPLACKDNIERDDPLIPNLSLLAWELTVDPGPILSDADFGFGLKAFAGFNEYFLNVAQRDVEGGVSRVNLLELRATVHVRRGAEDPEPIPLTFDPESIPWTCQYDANGNTEFAGRDFPSCSPENSNSDHSNDDCVGLGAAKHPNNRCGQFIDIRISDDCDGFCASLGDPFPVLAFSPFEQCELNGFCVEGPVEVELQGEREGYVAADAGRVLFGWDDVSTGAEIDPSNGRNHGTWILPDAVFDEPAGSNGLRARAGNTEEIAIECTMGISGWSPFAELVWDNISTPAPDHLLISFPIQEP